MTWNKRHVFSQIRKVKVHSKGNKRLKENKSNPQPNYNDGLYFKSSALYYPSSIETKDYMCIQLHFDVLVSIKTQKLSYITQYL